MRVPHRVICLLSALSFHQLTTQLPFEVWLAIAQKARHPKEELMPLRIVYLSGESRTAGIEEHQIEELPYPFIVLLKQWSIVLSSATKSDSILH
ncbi:type IV toxin-antitoxin system AbiEi family antitoxin domain-containing protein [Aphanothece hegewaldii]|uniref:type IV toxin-antitoxin system AbiEi family antitoxin domain-containing protein n=1 Tax=Aphanothece hegewaldii TaxID=1521625 RepID=UPI001FE2E6F0|nr:hypothetical protein [Aphanothece hegewaldii]